MLQTCNPNRGWVNTKFTDFTPWRGSRVRIESPLMTLSPSPINPSTCRLLLNGLPGARFRLDPSGRCGGKFYGQNVQLIAHRPTGEDAKPQKCAAHILASGEEFFARKLLKIMYLHNRLLARRSRTNRRHRMAYSGVTEKMVTIVQFRNTHAPVQTKSTTMSITIAPMLLSITSSILPSGTDGTAYSQTLHASGGIPVHT
jgi:hypothetical protein